MELRHEEIKEDYLIVSFDTCPKDDAVLIVSRHDGENMYVLNEFRNNEAWYMYNLLLGNMEL